MDICFSDEVILDAGKLNFYVEASFLPEEVLGFPIGEDDWVNIYAEYDVEKETVCDALRINLVRADGEESESFYPLSSDERESLRGKMEAYCGEALVSFAKGLEEQDAFGMKME